MQDNNIPAKFPKPFGAGAGAGYIRPIPEASQIGVQNGAASLTDGFPPNCFIAVAAGGSWPFGQDFNGLLNQATAWNQWQQAGGPVAYDGTFSTAIGGYPKGAVLSSATLGGFWLSTADNNTTDPDTGGAGWVPLYVTGTYAPDTGTTNTLAITLNPAPASLASLVGVPIRVKVATVNTGASTLNVNSLGATAITNPDGTALAAAQLWAGGIASFVYDGTQFALQSQAGFHPGFANTQYFTEPGTHAFVVPPGVTTIRDNVWGAGGGSGGVGSSGIGGGGAGAGGGFSRKTFAVTPGDSYTVTIGAGGTAGGQGGAGGNGGSSSFGSVNSATGGTGGQANTNGNGGTGGAGSGGDIDLPGSAGSASPTTGTVLGGAGGGSPFGAPGTGGGYGLGAAGVAPGGGAGGSGGAAANTGSAGGNGMVIIEW